MTSKANKTVSRTADRKVTGMKPRSSRAVRPSAKATPPPPPPPREVDVGLPSSRAPERGVPDPLNQRMSLAHGNGQASRRRVQRAVARASSRGPSRPVRRRAAAGRRAFAHARPSRPRHRERRARLRDRDSQPATSGYRPTSPRPTRESFGEVWGLIASPPCQAYSLAGKRLGRQDKPHVIACAHELAAGT